MCKKKMKKRIYLDYAASTPIDKKVFAAMMPYFKQSYGNPSSVHGFGQQARAGVEQAREQAARFLQCIADEVIFTSGASEANNLAIQGVVSLQSTKKPHVIVSAIEHDSVLELCKALEKECAAEVTYVKPNTEGIVQSQDVKNAITKNTVLVSVLYANSEIGTVQPIAAIGEMLAEYPNIVFHTDAVQAAHYAPCNVQELGVDLLTLSAHKIYGPKGAGLLYVRKGVTLRPLVIGGGQELKMRGGTENVPAIVGFGVALEQLLDPKMPLTIIKIRQLRDRMVKTLLHDIEDSKITGSIKHRLPNNIHLRCSGVKGKDLVVLLDQKGIAISTGSACAEKLNESSHVVKALNISNDDALSSVRITLGKNTTKEEVEKTTKAIVSSIARLRAVAI